MNKVLIAVDDTKASKAVLSTFYNSVRTPGEVILLHVQRLEGRSLMIDMLGDSEMATLKESLKDSSYKETLDRKAEKILAYYKKELEGNGSVGIRTVVREGIPADEIEKVSREENVGLIILGHSGRKGLNRIISGSVADEVRKNATVPVLVAKQTLMCEEPFSWKDAYAAVSVTTAVILGLFIFSFMLQRGAFPH